ncbi:MAG TPA: AAA family ATPase [Nocardioides sp.]|nr:AAA family ATPase [Nocardioides sp.]
MPHRRLLLERDDVLVALRDAWAAAASSRGSVHLLEGPAGIGKTAVINAFVDELRADPHAVLVARCNPLSATAPGGVVRDWFGPVLRRSGIGKPPFDGPGAAVAEATAPPAELMYAVQWVVEDLSATGPLLLVVDDVHWSDAASLAVLDHLTAAVTTHPLLVLVGRRSGEEPTAPEQLARVRRRARRHRLQPLSAHAASALLADLPAEDAAEVARQSEGIPLFLHELAEARRAGVGATPRGVVDIVHAVVSRMPESALDVARAVAVLARPVPPSLVADVVQVPEQQVMEVVDRLADAEFLTWTDADPGEVTLAHALVGDAFLDGLGAAGRADLHGRVADALLRAGAPDEEVAGHLLQTPASGRGDVHHLFTALGRQALASGAARLGARYFLRAVEEVDRPGRPSPEGLLREAARAQAAAGDIEEALQTWRRAAAGCDSVEAAARVMAEAGDALTDVGRHAEAITLWRTWLDRLPPGDAEETRKTLVVRITMNALSLAETPPEFGTYLDRVMNQPPEADSHGDRLIATAAAAGLVFGRTGSADLARALAVRAWGEGKLLEEETAAGAPLYVVSGVLDWTDAFDVALDLLDRAVEGARSIGSALTLATAVFCRGYARMRQGSVAAALDDLILGRDLRRFGWEAYAAPLLQGLVESYLVRGQVDAAREVEHDLTAFLGEHTAVAAYAYAGLSDLAVAEGRLDQAAQLLARLTELAGGPDNPALLTWRLRLARVRRFQDRPDDARALVAEELDLLQSWGPPRAVAAASLVAAELDLGDPEEHLREALSLTAPAPLRLTRERAYASLDLASTLLDADPVAGRDEAVELATFAHDRALAEGMAPLADRAAKVLVRCGITTDLAQSPLATLSPAERRVVERVLTGMTNREVAGDLFITVKAVEWHLSSVYRKLGVRGRRELAAAVAAG